MTPPSDGDLLTAFDRQVRQSLVPPQTGWLTERVGPVIRVTPPLDSEHGRFVEWSDLDETTADAAIAETVRYYQEFGKRFEWKTYGYDRPADLPDRLVRAGFVAEDPESLVIGPVESVVAACATAPAPTGVTIRPVASDADWAGIGAVHQEVWGRDGDHWVDGLRDEVTAVPETIDVLVADAGGVIVSAGWVRFHAGTDFASLWGGTTLPHWRRRGIYRALVADRADRAVRRGHRYLQVDASPDSRPILERLGLRVLTTTTPYVWTPPAPPS
jgi:hypothetical protein